MTFFLLAATLLSAEPPPPKHITFDETDVIEGDLKSPDLGLITADTAPRFQSIVRVRTDFKDKIAKERLP